MKQYMKKKHLKKTWQRTQLSEYESMPKEIVELIKPQVNLPLVLAKKMSGLTRLVPKNAKEDLNEQGIDLDSIDLAELIEMFENGEIEEDLVNIEAGDGDDATTVRIYVD